MTLVQHVLTLRVRYSETDQMGTFYNSRALEWFEVARTELLRSVGVPYAQMEQRGIFLPLVESHVHYRGRARYDDPLRLTTTVQMSGKASMRFDVAIVNAETLNPVADGYTLHAVVDGNGKPTRAPAWLVEAISPTGDPTCEFCHGGVCKGACRD